MRWGGGWRGNLPATAGADRWPVARTAAKGLGPERTGLAAVAGGRRRHGGDSPPRNDRDCGMITRRHARRRHRTADDGYPLRVRPQPPINAPARESARPERPIGTAGGAPRRARPRRAPPRLAPAPVETPLPAAALPGDTGARMLDTHAVARSLTDAAFTPAQAAPSRTPSCRPLSRATTLPPTSSRQASARSGLRSPGIALRLQSCAPSNVPKLRLFAPRSPRFGLKLRTSTPVSRLRSATCGRRSPTSKPGSSGGWSVPCSRRPG